MVEEDSLSTAIYGYLDFLKGILYIALHIRSQEGGQSWKHPSILMSTVL